MAQHVDLYQELKALVPACERCGKPLFTVLSSCKYGRPTQWMLEICDVEHCRLHCRCYKK